MSTVAIANNPKVDNFKKCFIARISQKHTAEIWKTSEKDHRTAWGVCDILQDKEIQQYIQDSTNIANYEKAAKVLSVPSVEDENVIISFQFYLSYTCIVREPGNLEEGM